MKRVIAICCIIVISSVSTFAQLNITSRSSQSEVFYRDTWISVTWNGAEFIATSSDPITALSLSFTLGTDKSSALLTLNQIKDWFNSADVKSSITFEDNSNLITLYKPDELEMVISTGDSEYIRKEFNRRLSGALLGTNQYRKKEETPHFSYIRPKALDKIIHSIWTLTDPKYIKGNPEDDPYVIQVRERDALYSRNAFIVDSTSKKIDNLRKQIKIARKNQDNNIDSLNVVLDSTKAQNKKAKEILRELEEQEDMSDNGYSFIS